MNDYRDPQDRMILQQLVRIADSLERINEQGIRITIKK